MHHFILRFLVPCLKLFYVFSSFSNNLGLKCFAIYSAFNDLRWKLKSFTSRAFSWTVERGEGQLSPFDDAIGWLFWKDNWPIYYRVGKLFKTVRSKCQFKVLWFPSKCLYMHKKYNLSNLSIFVMENKNETKLNFSPFGQNFDLRSSNQKTFLKSF